MISNIFTLRRFHAISHSITLVLNEAIDCERCLQVAERVADERGESLGNSVGYSIRLSHVIPREYGSITYCTTGILLRILSSDKYLQTYSHVIVDEVNSLVQSEIVINLLRHSFLSFRCFCIVFCSFYSFDGNGVSIKCVHHSVSVTFVGTRKGHTDRLPVNTLARFVATTTRSEGDIDERNSER